ncbi:MAG TPA: hypothetical protein VHZ55_03995 [Bryobacteraceae bacterium]|jgi:hypothetical protein|nr:hypothetical protein [Bryobacteraceae bacterium]
MGNVKKLKITSCTEDEKGNIKVSSSASDTFEVMINPAAYTHQRSVVRSGQRFLGSSGSRNKFDSILPEILTFDEIVLDGTGAVANSKPGKPAPDVKTQVANLVRVAYTFSGEKHEPPWVRLLWGDLIFFGCLTSLKVTYTLFKPTGEPLRAKISLAFKSTLSPEEEAKRANRSSPDLSHQVTVLAGDTLPLLCHRIYNDSSYYPEVARFNELDDFRNLRPGTQLLFPPLV